MDSHAQNTFFKTKTVFFSNDTSISTENKIVTKQEKSTPCLTCEQASIAPSIAQNSNNQPYATLEAFIDPACLYTKNVLNEVENFSKSHPNVKIKITVLGEGVRPGFLKTIFNNNNNFEVTVDREHLTIDQYKIDVVPAFIFIKENKKYKFTGLVDDLGKIVEAL